MSRSPFKKVIVLNIFFLLLAAVIGYSFGRWGTGRERPSVNPARATAMAENSAGNLVLSVWNQSFEIPDAEILVELQPIGESESVNDRELKRLFHRTMPVKDQHHVEEATFAVAPGKYELYAHELKSGTTGAWTILVQPSKNRGVLLNFWKDKANSVAPAPFFTLVDVDEGFGIL